MTLQFRDPDRDRLDGFEAAATELAELHDREGPVTVSLAPASTPIEPAAMDGELQAHLATAAQGVAPGRWTHLPSAAVHDAMFVATTMPAAMLFVPSIGGISHDAAEDTAPDDLVLGCRAVAAAARSILEATR
jgi:N-carbamoyl-L-amino-acid hydrolase